jgi:hypothetical protein
MTSKENEAYINGYDDAMAVVVWQLERIMSETDGHEAALEDLLEQYKRERNQAIEEDKKQDGFEFPRSGAV